MGVKYWAVIPAAGIGSRMQSECPKQYLKILDKTVLEHTLEKFCIHPRIAGVVVSLAANDIYWQNLGISKQYKIMTTTGGAERFNSVLNGLHYLRNHADAEDWVLVHDAVRPCVRHGDLDKLIEVLDQHPVGGLLAYPVKDTMKRANENLEVTETVDRRGLWHALTPQMFRLSLLEHAIAKAVQENIIITDEAQAVERCGYSPRLVEGRADNIKITRKEDLSLAELYLSNQE